MVVVRISSTSEVSITDMGAESLLPCASKSAKRGGNERASFPEAEIFGKKKRLLKRHTHKLSVSGLVAGAFFIQHSTNSIEAELAGKRRGTERKKCAIAGFLKDKRRDI